MKSALALVLVSLLGLGCERSRPATCVSGASSPCTCTTGLTGAQVCQTDGTFGACQCAPPPVPTPVVAPVAVVTPDVPAVAPAPVAAAPVVPPPAAPIAAAPRAPSAPRAPAAPANTAANGLPSITIPNLLPTAPAAGNTTAAPTAAPAASTAPTGDQLQQLGQLLSRGLNAQQIQSVTQAIRNANRDEAPDHPTFSPTELTRLSEMATQGGAGPSALQSAAQSMLGGD